MARSRQYVVGFVAVRKVYISFFFEDVKGQSYESDRLRQRCKGYEQEVEECGVINLEFAWYGYLGIICPVYNSKQ